MGKIDSLQLAYTAATAAVTACRTSDVGSTCDINQKNVLGIQLQNAGEKMIENDTVHQRNKVVYE